MALPYAPSAPVLEGLTGDELVLMASVTPRQTQATTRSIAQLGGSVMGTTWYVDTVNGSDTNSGRSSAAAFATMGRAFYLPSGLSNLGPNDLILFVGVVREQLVAPLTKDIDGVATAVTGVSIVGVSGGGVRDDGGSKWTYPASGAVAGQALLRCRQQGWSVSNFLMTDRKSVV